MIPVVGLNVLNESLVDWVSSVYSENDSPDEKFEHVQTLLNNVSIESINVTKEQLNGFLLSQFRYGFNATADKYGISPMDHDDEECVKLAFKEMDIINWLKQNDWALNDQAQLINVIQSMSNMIFESSAMEPFRARRGLVPEPEPESDDDFELI